MELDRVDAALLDGLQADGRASFEALGRSVGLSRIAARNRVQRLLDSGAVRIMTVVHPSVRGLTSLGHLSIRTEAVAEPVARAVAEMPAMPLVAMVAGRQSVIAEVRTESLEALRTAVEEVRGLHGVRHVDTCVYTERLKDRHSVTGPLAGPRGTQLDRADHRLIGALQRNGRATYAELGASAGLSASSARARVLSLVADGTMHIGAAARPGLLGLSHVCGFGLTLAADSAPLRTIAALPTVHYLAECVGGWDAIGTLLCASQDDTAEAQETIRATAGVRHLDSWIHLRLVKENYTLPGNPADSG